jgi:putative MATE family efflux protein
MSGNHISHQLEHDSIGKLLIRYSTPAIIGTVSNALYNVIDRAFIGQGVGPMAISGLALTLPLMVIFGAFGMLIGAGSSARISILIGQRNIAKAENVLGNAMVLTISISLVVYTLGFIFLDEILMALGGTSETIPYAREFMEIIIPGQIFATISFGYSNMMRASGYPTKAMLIMASGAVLNVILDPIFIFALDLGIRGAAIATVISMFMTSILVMHHFFQKNSLVRFKRSNFHLNRAIILSIFSIGLSPFLMQLAASVINILINHSLKFYGGDLAIGAWGIINSLLMILTLVIIGINQGMQPIVGFNYGAKKFNRMFKTLKYGMIAGTIITTFGFLLALFIPEVPVRIFTRDSELIQLSSNGLHLAMSMFFLVGFQMVAVNFFQAIGKAKISIFLSLTRQVIFLIPAILILPHFFGLNGVWYSMPIADTVSAITVSVALIVVCRKIRNEE